MVRSVMNAPRPDAAWQSNPTGSVAVVVGVTFGVSASLGLPPPPDNVKNAPRASARTASAPTNASLARAFERRRGGGDEGKGGGGGGGGGVPSPHRPPRAGAAAGPRWR